MSLTESSFGFSGEVSVSKQIVIQKNPHRDGSILRELYHSRGLSLRECADRLGCSLSTVRRWMDKHGIGTRPAHRPRVERASYVVNGGYPQWCVGEPDGSTANVAVHRLTVISDGADPYEVFSDETETHHRNGIVWDNRPGNVEVVGVDQHSRTHQQQSWTYDSGLGCRVLETVERKDGGEDNE